MTTKAEQETIMRFDQEERVLHLFTACPRVARKWVRLGYAVEVCGLTQDGQPRGWRATGPLEALRLRRLVEGQVVSRRRGRGFTPERRKTTRLETRSRPARPSGQVQSINSPEPAN